MKQVIIEAYEFGELNNAAKERARNWYRSANADDDYWSEGVVDEAALRAGFLGIELRDIGRGSYRPAIYWSGFSSQGDGACFEGTWRASDVREDKVADDWGPDPATTEIQRIARRFAEIAKEYPEASFTVTHRGYYTHENCAEFEFDFPDDNDGEDWPEEKREAWDKECENLKETAKDFMRWIYRALEKAYEYEQSDECVDDNIVAHNFLFTKDGSRKVAL